MLGKLFRNEFKCTWKTVVTIYAVVIAATILGCLFLGVEVFHTGKFGQVMAVTFELTYVFAIIALFLVTFLFICSRFYKTMYSDQGYLTHTLPVSALANFNVKLVTALVWLLLCGVILIVSVFALLFSADGKEMMDMIGHLNMKMLNDACLGLLGYKFWATVGILLLMMVLGCLNILCMVFAAFSLGQLFNQHKIGAAIGFGVGLYFVEQIASSILLIGWMNRFILRTVYISSSGEEYALTNERLIVWPIIISIAIYSLVEYLISVVIIRKHVNLD